MDPRVAFCGEVELVNASWSLDSGRTVELRLTGNAYERIHPFKRFQQRRNGRMGSRFNFSVASSKDGHIFLVTQVMLAGWKDSSYAGQTITMWLDDEAAVHPFAGFNRRKNSAPGDMFAVALVEIDDNEEAIDQAQRELVEGGGADPGGETEAPAGVLPGPAAPDQPGDGGARRRAGRNPGPGASPQRSSRKLSSQAHLMVTSPMFVRWLTETHPRQGGWTSELARRWAKREIKVESLSELDQSKEAAIRFERDVRKPYAKWNNQEPD